MTLAEMASFVCGKVRKSDARALVKCKGFLRQRYELIYNEALWRDSLHVFPFTFTPNAAGVPASWESTFLMPSVVDKVVAIRTAGQEVTAVGQEVLMRGDIDQFTESGQPVEFALGSPCVALLPAAYTFHDLQMFGGDVGQAWRAHYIDSTGNRIKVTGVFSAGTSAIAADLVRVVERVTKQGSTTQAELTTNATDVSLSVCPAADSSFPQRIPVRLIPGPSAATDLRALVKKKVVPLSDDGDAPELRNADNALIAFAQGDMWEYGRQIGKARLKYEEAGAVMTQLKQLHTWQEQTLVRAAPDVGDAAGSVGIGLSGKGVW